ncbi:uncharacterized protein LOC134815353 [Bolinopsis microptera]|uniref:uncharacterized protein LOC134815353 n=1 Tax=Bolinopsis microptera TaxID=2820187 RepID=UPI003079A1DE
MVPRVELVVVLVIVWVQSSNSQDYYVNAITEDHLCTIPPYNGAHIECEITAKVEPHYELIENNQVQSTCKYSVKSFTQSCTYNNSVVKTHPNSTHHFERTCLDFERICTLYHNVDGGLATCQEFYGECKVVSEVPKSRLAVGYPQYNPPICYPGFKPARTICNSTSIRCTGSVNSTITSTTEQKLTSCDTTCEKETVDCTNFTKTCNDTNTKWNERYKSSVSKTRGGCDVTTKKCTEHREFKMVLNTREGSKAHPEKKMVPELVKTYDCSTTSNLTYSTKFCVDYIMKNMKYKVECQSHGVKLAEYLINGFYKSTNVSVTDVTSYLTDQWEIIKKLCKDDCFTAVTREMRNCVSDLPIQDVLPGISHLQLRELMYKSADLLCASLADKKTEESCIEYLDTNSNISKQVVQNMSKACGTETRQWKKGSAVTCTDQCKNHLVIIASERERNPGCCLADLMKYKAGTAGWMEMISPDLFNDNLLVHLVEQCEVGGQILSCTEADGMHPAVIVVLVVIGIFSVAIFSGVVAFIVVFYQQMEYEGYKKGFLHNMIAT